MSKVLNIITGVIVVWLIWLGIYNIVPIGTGDLREAQLWMGIITLSIAIGLLVVFLRLIRK